MTPLVSSDDLSPPLSQTTLAPHDPLGINQQAATHIFSARHPLRRRLSPLERHVRQKT